MPRLSLQDLLNPVAPPVSTQAETPPVSSLVNSPPTDSHRVPDNVNVRLNRKTTVIKVYQYPLNTAVKYPETGHTSKESVAHVFEVDPDVWNNPANDMAYSRGEPSGVDRNEVMVSLLFSFIQSIYSEFLICNLTSGQGIKSSYGRGSKKNVKRDFVPLTRKEMYSTKRRHTSLQSFEQAVFQQNRRQLSSMPLKRRQETLYKDGWSTRREGKGDQMTGVTGV
ncbi:hypothetical protein PQX77_019279 [Marasmius sp. AFHP31]|nr:hypothetical protein PQX77_019279 [Marasmius sp. AFHP31]